MSGSTIEFGDAAFLERWRAGSSRDAAFEELFHALREQVFALCLHITGSPTDADDALQETFLAVHLNLDRFRGESRVSTWVHRIAVRSALRVRARRRSSSDLELLDPAAPAEDAVLARESSERIALAVNRLRADHRVVLSLFAVDGLKHSQIAEILGLPEGTVWSRLHVARKELMRELGD